MIGKDLQLRSVVSTNRAKLLASFQKHSRALEHKEEETGGFHWPTRWAPPKKQL